MTVGDYLAIATIAAPLCVKAFSDWQVNAAAKHNMALSRIAGMAARAASTIARTLATVPPGADPRAIEAALVRSAAAGILTEMGASSATVGADGAKIATIVQGELDKVVAPPVIAVAAVNAPAA